MISGELQDEERERENGSSLYTREEIDEMYRAASLKETEGETGESSKKRLRTNGARGKS